MTIGLNLRWIALTCLALASGCGLFPHPRPLPTIPGPENPEVARGTRLRLLEIGPGLPGRAWVRRLEDGEREPFHHPPGRVIDLSGPDQDGRVAYLLDRHRSHHLWIGRLGSPEARQPFPLGQGERHFNITSLALSPVGGRLALYTYRVPEHDANARVESLEVLDLSTGTFETVWTGGCLDFTWLGEDRRLAFTDRSEEGTVVRVLDLDSSSVTATMPGGNGRLWAEPRGKHLFLMDRWGGALWRVDPASGVSEPCSLPGLHRPIGFSSDGRVVGYGLPTEGSKQEYTYFFASQQPKYPIRLFDIESGTSCTVVPPANYGNGFYLGEVAD